jgi:hypothetical protein
VRRRPRCSAALAADRRRRGRCAGRDRWVRRHTSRAPFGLGAHRRTGSRVPAPGPAPFARGPGVDRSRGPRDGDTRPRCARAMGPGRTRRRGDAVPQEVTMSDASPSGPDFSRLGDQMERAIDRIVGGVSAESVFGKPERVGDRLVITAAAVQRGGGFGFGGGSGATSEAGAGGGGGGDRDRSRRRPGAADSRLHPYRPHRARRRADGPARPTGPTVLRTADRILPANDTNKLSAQQRTWLSSSRLPP